MNCKDKYIVYWVLCALCFMACKQETKKSSALEERIAKLEAEQFLSEHE